MPSFIQLLTAYAANLRSVGYLIMGDGLASWVAQSEVVNSDHTHSGYGIVCFDACMDKYIVHFHQCYAKPTLAHLRPPVR